HVYLDVRFEDGAIGLHGPNGVGKTWLFEAPVAVAYGEWPSRTGSLYDNMTTGFLGEGRIEIEFDSDDRSYRALRILSKT
ncbi:AAA family ATPase, partial [Xanthomonas citri pv. citri]|nr:AAA family ATPase [Xanthomonas citri pv. citri]